MKYLTEQENFWAGQFGEEYIKRNQSQDGLSGNIAAFSKILSSASSINSVIEFGANIGLNLRAIKSLLPNVNLTAIEINETASKELNKIGGVNVINSSILNASINDKHDMTLIKGVLIHINPEDLDKTYEKLYNLSNKYICVVEYYNPSPVEIDYRGNREKLFKRDFAGEILDKYNDLELIDYGFLYSRDNNFSYDDSTWFLLKKQG